MAGILYDPFTNPLGLIETALPMPQPSLGGIPTAVPLPPIMPTLGQRNNNYGNLRTTDAFLGKTGSGQGYDTYETPEMGLRALARVLDTYSTKHGINTIDALVNRYAPASDNTGGSHENYKKFLSQQLGIGINDPIDVRGRRAELMDAIIRFENKNRALATQDQIQQAILAADNENTPSVSQNINTTTGDNQMANGNGILSVEEDYKIGSQYNGAYFEYPENYIRYEKEKKEKNKITTDAPTNMANAQLMRPYVDAQQAQAQPTVKASDGVLSAVKNMQLNAILDDAIASPDTNEVVPNNSVASSVPNYPDAILQGRNPQNQTANGYGNASVLRPFINDPSVNQAQPNTPIGILEDDVSLYTDPSQLHANETMGIVTPSPNAQANTQEQVTKMLPASGYRNYIQNVGKRRDKTEMSLSPQPMSPYIDTNEMLMRVGLAGVGGSQRGGLQALSDMGAEYGAIQDANRASKLEAYKASLRNKPDTTKADAETIEKIAQMDQVLLDFDRAKAYLNEGDVTGPIDYGFFGYYDMAVGNEDQNARLLLQKLRVDYTLLQIAQTKGAISNQEMDLFLSPAPSLNDQESVWIEWIDKRQKAVKTIRDRLANGVVLPSGQVASSNQVEQFNKPTVEVSPNVKAAREALKQ